MLGFGRSGGMVVSLDGVALGERELVAEKWRWVLGT